MQKGSVSAEEAQSLKESLKRCPEGTYEAVIAFREHRDVKQLPVIVMGIIERYVEPEVRPKVRSGSDTLHLIDDLGIDSLTMMEIVILVEEVLEVSFENSELRELRTVGDIKSYMSAKIDGGTEQPKSLALKVEHVAASLPMQHPFLFVQEATLEPESAQGSYTISGAEPILEGHFKGDPVFPASILLEALGQLSVLHLLKSGVVEAAPEKVYFASCDGVRAHRICRPGDTLQMQVTLKRTREPMATYSGQITVNGEKAAFVEELSLIFGSQTGSSLDGEPEKAPV